MNNTGLTKREWFAGQFVAGDIRCRDSIFNLTDHMCECLNITDPDEPAFPQPVSREPVVPTGSKAHRTGDAVPCTPRRPTP